MKVPFYKAKIGSGERQAIEDIISGKSYEAVEDFEAAFEQYTGAGYAVATSHGTSALHLAMLAIDLKRGDKVVCSVNASPAVPEVVRHFDAEPVFIDILEDDYNINLDKLETYLEDNQAKKLKAVIVTHIAGQPGDLERLYNIAKIYDVKVVEDATDALGASYNGTKIGATGADITCFSFSPHLRHGVVNGGMLVSEDEEIVERAKLLRNHAIVQEDDVLEYIYDVTDIGNNYAMSELEAAFLSEQLKKQNQAVERQQKIAAIYNEKLSGVAHIELPKIGPNHACSLYIIRIDKNRDSFARDLVKKGIEVGLHYIPLHLLSYYKSKYSLRVNDYPVALRAFQQILTLPIYAAMEDKEIDYVCKTIKEVAADRV